MEYYIFLHQLQNNECQFVVLFFLWLSTSHSQIVIKTSSKCNLFYSKWWSFHWNEVIILSILLLNEKRCHLMTTWDQEVKSKKRKNPQIPGQNGFSHRKLRCQLLYPIFYAVIIIVPPLTVYIQKRSWLCYCVEQRPYTVAINELLCLKNAGAQISMFFT